MLMFQQPEFQIPVAEPDINNRLESLCLSMTEHALGGEWQPLLSPLVRLTGPRPIFPRLLGGR
ncbi:UNVERIFIED_CONTAM: hypothetical protein K2H54_012973, partial [Gekko kuhli]